MCAVNHALFIPENRQIEEEVKIGLGLGWGFELRLALSLVVWKHLLPEEKDRKGQK